MIRLIKSKNRFAKDTPNPIEEYNTCIEDLIHHRSIQMMREFRHHGLITCYQHSIHVSKYSYYICKICGLNYLAAARGGLLHDLFLYDWHTTKPAIGKHGFVHPRIAFNNAKELFPINPIESDIILKHMFPLTLQLPRFKETVVVCLVDKMCTVMELIQSFIKFLLNYSMNDTTT